MHCDGRRCLGAMRIMTGVVPVAWDSECQPRRVVRERCCSRRGNIPIGTRRPDRVLRHGPSAAGPRSAAPVCASSDPGPRVSEPHPRVIGVGLCSCVQLAARLCPPARPIYCRRVPRAARRVAWRPQCCRGPGAIQKHACCGRRTPRPPPPPPPPLHQSSTPTPASPAKRPWRRRFTAASLPRQPDL